MSSWWRGQSVSSPPLYGFSDLIVALTSNVELFQAIHSGQPFVSSCHSKIGETFCYLKIDGIDGESPDAKHPNEIQIQSWSFGETQGGSHSAGGGGGAGKVVMQDFNFTMKVNKAKGPIPGGDIRELAAIIEGFGFK